MNVNKDDKATFEEIQRFIANNEDLERLEAILNTFNPLRVMKIVNHEIRHSNILSWLLDPKGNHNLGDSFLKKFLTELIINNEQLESNMTVFDIQDKQLYDLQVKREWNNIDILLSSDTAKVVILIENKVYAGESKGQLIRYYNIVAEAFNGYELLPVYITLHGDEPSEEKYGAISYSKILSILRFVLSMRRDNLSNKVYDFIEHYIETLELLTMDNKEIKELCKKIYREHTEALDLIYDYAEDTEFTNAAVEFIASISAKSLYSDNSWFMPSEYLKFIDMVGEESWCQGWPFAFWYITTEEKLGIIMEVGPFKEEAQRHSFLSHLKKNGFKINDRSFKPGAKYTRIFTKYVKFDDWDNKESIVNTMDKLFHTEAKKARENLLKACKNYSWSK